VLPITPPQRLHAAGLDAKNEVFADSVGWTGVARQVQTIYAGLPEEERRNAVIISAYYGVPGDYYWLPRDLTATEALMIDYQPADVAWMCASPTLVGHLTVPYGVKGLEQGAPVTFCRLTALVASVWPRLRNFS